LLPKSELTERELIIELVNIVELFATENSDWVNWDIYRKAKLYLDPNYDETKDY
jgi:hypothetical protein